MTNYDIYSDPEETQLIDSKEYSVDTVMNQTISIDNYLEKASTITHIYKNDKETGRYYFESNKIS